MLRTSIFKSYQNCMKINNIKPFIRNFRNASICMNNVDKPSIELKDELDNNAMNRRIFQAGGDNALYDRLDNEFLLEKTQSALLNWPKAQITTLSNGMRVATEQTNGETVTVGVWVNSGSRYENEDNNGVAHFSEHLFFKGTPNRTTADLEVEVENIGGHLNAYTSRECTVFYAQVFKNDVAQAVDILSDILQNSTFTQEAVERERGVILREMEEVNNQIEEVIFDDLHSTAFQKTPLGFTILGPEEKIRTISRDDLMSYRRNHLTADRMVICAAGPLDHGELIKLVEEKFNKIPEKPEKSPILAPAYFTGSDIRVRYDDQPFAHVAIAWPTCGWLDADTITLQVLQTMIGSWDQSCAGGVQSSSPLIAQVSANHLARSMTAFNTLYSDTGLFGLYFVAEDKALDELMGGVMKEVVSHCYDVDQERLFEAKNQLKMATLAQLDGTTSICEELGRQVLQYGRRIHPIESLKRVDQVDTGAVEAAANRFVYDHDFALAAHGPIYELPDYNWIRRRSYWLRY